MGAARQRRAAPPMDLLALVQLFAEQGAQLGGAGGSIRHLVDLGHRLGHVGLVEDVVIGLPVELTWIERYGAPFPVFRPSALERAGGAK